MKLKRTMLALIFAGFIGGFMWGLIYTENVMMKVCNKEFVKYNIKAYNSSTGVLEYLK